MEGHGGDRRAPPTARPPAAPLGGEADRRRDLGLGNGHDRVEDAAQVGEGPSSERLGPGPVGDGPRTQLGRPAHDLRPIASESRASAASSGSTPMTRALGPQGPDGGGDAARQPAAADRHQDDRQVGRSSTSSSPIVPCPAMIRSSSKGGMIVRPRSARDLLGDPLPLVAGGPDDDDWAPSAATRSRLMAGRIGRHDDDGRRSEQARGPGDPLGVITRRVGDRRRVPAASGDREAIGDIGAAELERPDRLERLGLQVPARLGAPEADERRSEHDTAQPFGGGPDVVDGDERRVRRRPSSRSRAASRWHSMQRAAHGRASRRASAIGPPQRARTYRRSLPRAARAPRRQGPAGGRPGHAGRDPVAVRRPGWPRRPATRRSSGRARRSPRRSPREGEHARPEGLLELCPDRWRP